MPLTRSSPARCKPSQLVIPIKRIPTSFIYKQLVPSSLTVFGSLLSLHLDPSDPQIAGMRISIIMWARPEPLTILSRLPQLHTPSLARRVRTSCLQPALTPRLATIRPEAARTPLTP